MVKDKIKFMKYSQQLIAIIKHVTVPGGSVLESAILKQ